MRHRHKFNSSEGAWKASTVLKASFWRWNIVDSEISQADQNLRNILQMLSWFAIASQSGVRMSEWPPEGCTCTLFREMFSERFQKHLEAQSKIFADKTTKMRSNEALKQRKQSIFDDLPCANGGHSASCAPVLPPCLSFALPHFTFWECHFTFSGVPALKVFTCAGETWEVLAPAQGENLRFQECFRDRTVGKEHWKAPWQHCKWHSWGFWTPPKAWRCMIAAQEWLQMLHKCFS